MAKIATIDATSYASIVYTPEKYIESITFRRKGQLVELSLGKTTENVGASLGTVSIGTAPDMYKPKSSENGVIIATLSGIPIYFGVNATGLISVRFCGDIAVGSSLHGRFSYIAAG